MVGDVAVGGDAPVSVQSMTNTPTADVRATAAQISALAVAGADIVRVSCPDSDSTAALRALVGESPVPLVADIHFHYRRAVEAARAGAACLRINPGNIGSAARVGEVVAAARDHGCSMRIGVNAGSLERRLLEKHGGATPEAMVESALDHLRVLEDNDFHDVKISVKASNVALAVGAYRGLAAACDCPLHLGVTEAGGLIGGTVKSALGIGMLLAEGIGDTIRVSLATDPVKEVQVGWEILKALDLRRRGVNIIACPSCARQQFQVTETVAELERRLAHVDVPMTLSIIGCVVNGPGEARMTDIGLTGGGRGRHLVYMAGKADHKVSSADLVDRIVELVEARAAEPDGAAARSAARAR